MIQTLLLRGQPKTQVWVSSARLKVDAHGKKRFIIAIKYQNEENYRYWVVADPS